MKKVIFYTILSVFFLSGCISKKIVTDTQSDRTSDRVQLVDYIHKTITKDSVIIRDSVVYHADGSKSTYHAEKSSKTDIQRVFYRIFNKLTITKTIKIIHKEFVTKERRGFFWFVGLLTCITLPIFSIYKLNNKFSLWQKLTGVWKGLKL